MKKTISWLGSILLVSSLFTGCGGDNAHDGKTGLIGGSGGVGTANALSSIQKNILQANADDFLKSLDNMSTSLVSKDTNLTNTHVEDLQSSFVKILKNWKAVHTTYIAGKYDTALTDTPRFIEYFIKASKRQDIPADVQSALDSTTEIKAALFKNTSKSMQALEYLVYGKQESIENLVIALNKNNHRRVDGITVVLESLKVRATSIADFYKNDTEFVSDTTRGLNALSNQLVQSSFDLREKRIGEPAGIVGNSSGNTNPSGLPYYNSKNSLLAAKAILETNKKMMGIQSFENFGSFAIANGASSIVTQIRDKIDEALALTEKLAPLDEVITDAGIQDDNVEKLYNVVRELENFYQQSLIESLDLTAQLVDADGD